MKTMNKHDYPDVIAGICKCCKKELYYEEGDEKDICEACEYMLEDMEMFPEKYESEDQDE